MLFGGLFSSRLRTQDSGLATWPLRGGGVFHSTCSRPPSTPPSPPCLRLWTVRRVWQVRSGHVRRESAQRHGAGGCGCVCKCARSRPTDGGKGVKLGHLTLELDSSSVPVREAAAHGLGVRAAASRRRARGPSDTLMAGRVAARHCRSSRHAGTSDAIGSGRVWHSWRGAGSKAGSRIA